MSVVLTFALAAIILILGFIGNYLFKRTSVPDILILIAFGFLIGPAFRIINPTLLLPISEILASLALLIILFDAGLNLNIKKVVQDSPRATALTFIGFFVSTVFVASFTYFVLGWNVLNSLLLGSILGGISSSVVIPLISRLNVSDKVSTILSLESAFTDSLVIVFGLTILQLMTSPLLNNVYDAGNRIAGAFSIAIVVGIAAGVLWLKILKYIKKEIYDDILTLAIVLLFYSVTETLGGNGAIFALTFGLVLGNGIRVLKVMGIKERIEASRVMKKFQSQMSFFIRTFFFVFIGMIFSVTSPLPLYVGVLITLILLAGRYISVTLVSIKDKVLDCNRNIMSLVMGRGLAAAVLAEVVRSSNLPGATLISDIVVVVIISSVVLSTVSISFFGMRLNRCDSELKKVEKKKISSVKTK